MISTDVLAIYLAGSIFFCWAAVSLAMPGRTAEAPEVVAPSAQANTALGVFAVFLLLSVAVRMLAPSLPAIAPGRLDTAFSAIIIFAVFAVSSWYGDSPAQTGLSLRNISTVVFFLVPPVGIVLLPGGRVNMALLLGGIVPSIAIAGAAEEILFKGYMQTRLQAAWGSTAGLLAAALAASVFRIPMFIQSGSAVIVATQLVFHFLLWGCVGGLIFNRTRNVYGLILLRVFLDTAPLVFAGIVVN